MPYNLHQCLTLITEILNFTNLIDEAAPRTLSIYSGAELLGIKILLSLEA